MAVVQPHRYTRLRDTFEQFATCLNDADVAIIAPVYAAGEAPIEGINRDTYAEALRAHGHRNVITIDGEDDLAAAVAPYVKPGARHCRHRRRLDHRLDAQSAEEAGGSGVMMTRPCDMLPPVRGTYTRGAPLKDLVWFRAGGPAEMLFRPADAEDLATFWLPGPPICASAVIGVGSNLLVRDGGIPGVVVRLSSAFGKIEIDGTRVRAGAAALDGAVARAAADAGIAGLEFLRGVPGTIGGALKMNAGCYGREIKDIFVEATAIDGKGKKITLSAADMAFRLSQGRRCRDDLIFVEAVFEGTHGRARRHPRPHGGACPPTAKPASRSSPRPAARPSRIRPATRPGN